MKYTLLALIGLSLLSCTGGMNSTAFVPPEDSKTIVVDPSINDQDDGDRTTISRVEVMGDYLVLDVSYSGGCEDHEFDLLSRGEYSATYPPVVDVVLRHDANNDKCRSYVDDRLFIDLKPLQYNGTTRISLRLINNDKQYEYIY